MQPLGQLFHLRERRLNEQSQARTVIAQQDRMFEEGVLHERILDRLRRNILAVKGDNDVFEAIGNDKKAIFVDVPNIPSVQPAIFDCCGSGLRGLPISFHDVGTAVENLPLLSRCHLATHQRPASSAELVSAWRVEAHQRGGLCQPVSLAHQQPAGGEELFDLFAQWSSAGRKHSLGSTDGVTDGLEDETIGNPMTRSQRYAGAPSLLLGLPPLAANPY